MATDAGSATPGPRQEILRGVLEANRRLSGQPGAPAPVVPAARSRQRRTRTLLALPLLATVVGVAAFNATGHAPGPTVSGPVAEVAGTPAPAAIGAADAVQPAAHTVPVQLRLQEATPAEPFLPPLPDDVAVPPVALRGVTPRPLQTAFRPAAESDTPETVGPDMLAAYASPQSDSGLSLRKLFGLGVHTIVIDPGHGGYDPGTSGKLGTLEKEVTLDVAVRLKELLELDHSFRVMLTRYADVHVPLNQRVEFANTAGADLFISIHVNYLPNSTLNIVETYYFGAHTDPEALKLVERENRGSNYSMSDFESLVLNMRDTIKLQESKRLAAAIQKSLTGNMQRTRHPLHDVGTKTAPFVVLLGAKAPAVLAEISCMCNPEAEQRLRTPGHREAIARYLAEGIVNYLQENANKGDEPNDRQRQAKNQPG